jgi:hypothetical protein
MSESRCGGLSIVGCVPQSWRVEAARERRAQTATRTAVHGVGYKTGLVSEYNTVRCCVDSQKGIPVVNFHQKFLSQLAVKEMRKNLALERHLAGIIQKRHVVLGDVKIILQGHASELRMLLLAPHRIDQELNAILSSEAFVNFFLDLIKRIV